jgi:hypothetical protein
MRTTYKRKTKAVTYDKAQKALTHAHKNTAEQVDERHLIRRHMRTTYKRKTKAFTYAKSTKSADTRTQKTLQNTWLSAI